MATTRRSGLATVAVLLSTAALMLGGAAPAAADTAATSCSLASTGGTVTRTIGGRSYRLHVPAGLSGPSVPLVLSLHGNQQPVANHESETGWNGFAASRGFIVAYPVGSGQPLNWNYAQGSPDVAFLRNVAADISATWCVDPRRVHAEGYSNGAIMVERLACDAADVFASVAAYAGSSPSISGSPCVLSRPVAVGIFLSAFDPVSSYPIGVQNRDEWIARNGCPSTPTTESGVLLEARRYAPCNAGVEVVWRVYALQSHNWPVGADNADIRNRIWALFERNPLPAA